MDSPQQAWTSPAIGEAATDQRVEAVNAFVKPMEERAQEVRLIVFVCGPKVELATSPQEGLSGARLRRYLSEQLEQSGMAVVWGEHRSFQEAGGHRWIRQFNNADKEVQFAYEAADLVIIIPDSPGSIAELGGFALHNHIPKKMLIIFDRCSKGDGGYVIQALARAARDRKATISFRNYENARDIWRVVKKRVETERMIKMTALSHA